MPRTLQRIDDHLARYPLDVGAIADARRDLQGWIASWTSDQDTRDDVTIVVSELVANGIAASPPDSSVLVGACVDGDDLVVEVANRAAHPPVISDRPDVTDPLRGTGRGLLIVKALMDDVEVDARDGWTIVRCQRRIGGPRSTTATGGSAST